MSVPRAHLQIIDAILESQKLECRRRVLTHRRYTLIAHIQIIDAILGSQKQECRRRVLTHRRYTIMQINLLSPGNILSG